MVEKMTEEQKEFLNAEGKVVINACPGSGKTYTVAHKLLSYVDSGRITTAVLQYYHLRMWQVMKYMKKHNQFMVV